MSRKKKSHQSPSPNNKNSGWNIWQKLLPSFAAVGGIFALFFKSGAASNLFPPAQQFIESKIKEEELIANRFSDAAKEMKDSSDGVASSGIQKVKLIITKYPKHQTEGIDKLAIFIQERSPSKNRDLKKNEDIEKSFKPILQEALTIIKRRNTVNDMQVSNSASKNEEIAIVRLKETDLTNADLSSGHFQKTDFNRTNLSHAVIRNADLTGSYLTESNLYRADLRMAKLDGAELIKANLSRAHLDEGTSLQNANLKLANLRNTDLSKVKNIEAKQIKSACYWNATEEIKSYESYPKQKKMCDEYWATTQTKDKNQHKANK